MCVFANASVTIEFSPFWLAVLAGLLVGAFLIYKGVELFFQQPRYGALFIVFFIVAGIYARAILQDLGYLATVMHAIGTPGFLALIGLPIAALIWALSLLIYGKDLLRLNWKKRRRWGAAWTVTGIAALSAIGLVSEHFTGMPSTQLITEVTLGVVTFASLLSLLSCVVFSEL
jgi:hypothetical protein